MLLTMARLSDRVIAFVESTTGNTCRFILGTEHCPFSGGECRVFALEAAGRKISVRVERANHPLVRTKVEMEIQHLQAITSEGISHLPHLIGYDISLNPPLIATTWADGNAMVWSDVDPPLEVRRGIIRTVAEVTLDMMRIQQSGGP